VSTADWPQGIICVSFGLQYCPPYGVGPDLTVCRGMLILELHGAEMAERAEWSRRCVRDCAVDQKIKGTGSDGPFDCRTHRVPKY
jgi:hypothetical protein